MATNQYYIKVELKKTTKIEKVFVKNHHSKHMVILDSHEIINNTNIRFNSNSLLSPSMYVLTFANKPLANFFISDSID